MNVLVACEFSGRVREAFRAKGHNAYSCDLLPTDIPSEYHWQANIFDAWHWGDWDLIIAHPPCDHLAVSGARWFPEKRADGRQQAGIDFFMEMVNAPAPRVAVENPVGIMSTLYRKPDQIIQPYEYGHRESKKTCLWLKGLPLLVPTDIVEPEWYKLKDGSEFRDAKGKRYSPAHIRRRWDNQTPSGQNKLSPGPERWKLRSTTYQGIADAMAAQWGDYVAGL